MRPINPTLALKTGSSGTLCDQLSLSNGATFTIIGEGSVWKNCSHAVGGSGGWWYHGCPLSNLNGHYYKTQSEAEDESKNKTGIMWYCHKNSTTYSFKKAVMQMLVGFEHI